jgi:hypothetical protein
MNDKKLICVSISLLFTCLPFGYSQVPDVPSKDDFSSVLLPFAVTVVRTSEFKATRDLRTGRIEDDALPTFDECFQGI